MAEDEEQNRESRALEERIDRFVSEIAILINGAAPELRRDLRDLATGLLRERLADAEKAPAASTAGTGPAPFSALAVAIPLLLVGVLLVFLFPPVGVVILVVAIFMLVWGLIASVLFPPAKKRR